jgi:glyoxylase-like metal-dependent hydrolase (beta-lactamase superfamily II)
VTGIDAAFDGMAMTLYLIEGERATLIDSGVNTTPVTDVVPALAELDAAPDDIRSLLHTHAHVDHIGGDAALRALNRRLWIATPRAGAGWVESHRRYFTQAYRGAFPGLWNPPEALEERILRLCGEDSLVDAVLDDGDVFDAGAGHHLTVIATPAHSHDHVLFHDERNGVVFTGDALQVRGVERADGSWLFPLYADAALYRRALDTIERTRASIACTGHNGVLGRDGLRRLLAECRTFADELDALLLDLLADRGPASLETAVRLVQSEWRQYDGALQMYTTISAHLDDLAHRGLLERDLDDGRKVWRR